MARAKSGDKRSALLAAAIGVFAEHGPAAPTAEISRRANLAEGTLFTYFKTKDDLVGAVRDELQSELAHAMMAGFPHGKSFRRQSRQLWDGCIRWGVDHPAHRRVLAQWEAMDALPGLHRHIVDTALTKIQSVVQEAMGQKLVRRKLTAELVSRALLALTAATMDCMLLQPEVAAKTQAAGFKIFWKGIARRKTATDK